MFRLPRLKLQTLLVIVAIIAVELAYSQSIEPGGSSAILAFEDDASLNEAIRELSSERILHLAASDPIHKGKGLPMTAEETRRELRVRTRRGTCLLVVDMATGDPMADTQVIYSLCRAYSQMVGPACTVAELSVTAPVPLGLRLMLLIKPTLAILGFVGFYIRYCIRRSWRARCATESPPMVTS